MIRKGHVGNTTISRNTDTHIGRVIEFPYKKEGFATEALLGRFSHQFPYSHIGCLRVRTRNRTSRVVRTRNTQAHVGFGALTPPLKTPHLGYTGVPPPATRGKGIMSDGGEEAAVAVAEEFIMGGAGIIDVDADDAELPVLRSIWECPWINKCSGFDDNGKAFLGWTCGWCPRGNDGSEPIPFRTMNATKALAHVVKVAGYDIRPCRGNITAAKSNQYKALYLLKTLTKEERMNRKDTMSRSISDLQDRTVLSLAAGAKSSSRHAFL